MDKSREQFEEFAQREKLSLAYGDCGYVYTSTEMAWRAWQASRAAVEIELPKYHDYTNQDTTRAQAEKSAYNSGVYDSAEVIRAAGLKVKGE
ncbi:hypothetical protein R2217_000767 [Cronobacter turicensis]|nr:hypothetical protein [Cronobacter turicensis]ELQ6074657.1 hypothetical protein [Cronobacter turicensis]ELQ6183757.1 hypothetical protein [Cronobacter turicensis]ELQ6234703.1 hypothetical protein [Cronobacter turicensis]ELQ6238583.1 hypothetical protein [Cronobacter turicensis]